MNVQQVVTTTWAETIEYNNSWCCGRERADGIEIRTVTELSVNNARTLSYKLLLSFVDSEQLIYMVYRR